MSESERDTLVIGRVSGVYGVRGWVRIHSFTEPMENLLGYGDWKLNRRGHWETIEIDDGRLHGKGLIAHIVGIDNRDAAVQLKGCDIAIPRGLLPALESEEYYWHQLEGLAVYTGQTLLGRVDHLMETGSNDVLVVRACEGSLDNRERLIPWIRGQVVEKVDLEGDRIDVSWDPEF